MYLWIPFSFSHLSNSVFFWRMARKFIKGKSGKTFSMLIYVVLEGAFKHNRNQIVNTQKNIYLKRIWDWKLRVFLLRVIFLFDHGGTVFLI